MYMDKYFKTRLLFMLFFLETSSGVIVEFSFTTNTSGSRFHSGKTPDILDYTEHLDKYGIEGSKITSLKFKVKASRDANVYLSSSVSMDSAMPFYDLNVGAHFNSKTQLVRRTDDILSPQPFATTWNIVNNRHYLNYLEFRDFWVSWEGGIIRHGGGSVIGDDIIGEWADPEPFPVKSIGVLNSFDTAGDWIIHDTVYGNASNHFINCSPPNERVDLNIYKPAMILSATMCALECKRDEQCMGFNYNDNRCELLSFRQGVVTTIPKIPQTGWKFYTKCYVQRNECIDCLL